MNLIPNAGQVLLKSWAVRFAGLTALLITIKDNVVALPPEITNLPGYSDAVHWLTVAAAIATAVSRVVQQQNLSGKDSAPPQGPEV